MDSGLAIHLSFALTTPGFAAIAIVTLALPTGINAAIFSIVNFGFRNYQGGSIVTQNDGFGVTQQIRARRPASMEERDRNDFKASGVNQPIGCFIHRD